MIRSIGGASGGSGGDNNGLSTIMPTVLSLRAWPLRVNT